MTDILPEKIWAFLAAIVSALGGYVVYEKRKVDDRIAKLEADMAEHKLDVVVLQETLKNLKEDTEEIKEFQKATVDILTAMNIRKRK